MATRGQLKPTSLKKTFSISTENICSQAATSKAKQAVSKELQFRTIYSKIPSDIPACTCENPILLEGYCRTCGCYVPLFIDWTQKELDKIAEIKNNPNRFKCYGLTQDQGDKNRNRRSAIPKCAWQGCNRYALIEGGKRGTVCRKHRSLYIALGLWRKGQLIPEAYSRDY